MSGRSIFSYRDVLEFHTGTGMLFRRQIRSMSIMNAVTISDACPQTGAAQGIPWRHAGSATRSAPIKKSAQDSPFRLSGGQQQLLCLAVPCGESGEVFAAP